MGQPADVDSFLTLDESPASGRSHALKDTPCRSLPHSDLRMLC